MMSPLEGHPTYLDPSPLGTKEYWQSLYKTDLQTRSTLPSHTGTTWFDDANAEKKTLRYLASFRAETSPDLLTLPPVSSTRVRSQPSLSRARTSFLDLGTGNGSQLFALRRAGWAGHMVGVDYSPESVELASELWQEIMAKREQKHTQHSDGAGDAEEGKDEHKEDSTNNDSDADSDAMDNQPSTAPIRFEIHDVLFPSPSPPWMPMASGGGFDVVLDKGTFDAISLSDEVDSQGKRPCERYAGAVTPLVRKGGMLLITSCNWTQEELTTWICGSGLSKGQEKSNDEEDGFEVCGSVPYSRFKFGGVEGQTVVGLAFRRR